MTMKIGINGFGRIGRLALRAAYSWEDMEFVQINDPAANTETFAHLLNFDSVHGRWQQQISYDSNSIIIGDHKIEVTQNRAIEDTNWSACDVVIEATGKMKTRSLLNAYLEQGVKRVVVSAPIKEQSVLNIVVGVNDHLYDPKVHDIVTCLLYTSPSPRDS